jgi:hypothetical protein
MFDIASEYLHGIADVIKAATAVVIAAAKLGAALVVVAALLSKKICGTCIYELEDLHHFVRPIS